MSKKNGKKKSNRGGAPKLDKDQVKSAMRRIRKGDTFRAVASDLGVHPTAIQYQAKKAGISSARARA